MKVKDESHYRINILNPHPATILVKMLYEKFDMGMNLECEEEIEAFLTSPHVVYLCDYFQEA